MPHGYVAVAGLPIRWGHVLQRAGRPAPAYVGLPKDGSSVELRPSPPHRGPAATVRLGLVPNDFGGIVVCMSNCWHADFGETPTRTGVGQASELYYLGKS